MFALFGQSGVLSFLGAPPSVGSNLLMGLILLGLSSSNILASINLWKLWKPAKSPDDAADRTVIGLPKTSTAGESLIRLKQSNFTTPGTLEAAIFQFMKKAPEIPHTVFFENPGSWIDRYNDKRKLNAALSVLMLVFSLLAIFLIAAKDPNSQSDVFLLGLMGIMTASLAMFSAIHAFLFHKSYAVLSEYAKWREKYGLTIELAMIQTAKGRALMTKDGVIQDGAIQN